MIGGFSTGDVATVGEAIGKHLVEEARVARYLEASEPRKPAAAKKTKAAAKVSPAATSADSDQE